MYGFKKIQTATFEIKVGDIAYNIKQIAGIVEQGRADVIVFPELCVCGYTCGDMFTHIPFISKITQAIKTLVVSSVNISNLFVIGAPVLHKDKLYNCAIFIQRGRVLGIIPKSFIPNYNEFYERRWFTSWDNKPNEDIYYINKTTIGTDQIFKMDKLRIACEICEDLWVAENPSIKHSLNGANCIINLSASNDIIGKKEYRKNLVKMQSAKCQCAYIYCSAGFGESTSDLVWSGHQIIAQCGHIVKENTLQVGQNSTSMVCNIDFQKINNDRLKQNSTNTKNDNYRIEQASSTFKDVLPPKYNAYPFVPKDKNNRKQRCEEIIRLQATALATRLKKTNISKMVIGISGGLDSTLALLVCLETCKLLKLSTSNIIGVTMPCFGTSNRTLKQAKELMDLSHITQMTVDIKEAVHQHLMDIKHDLTPDVTFENAQARERTQVIMDIANKVGGLVIGTGDLSEIALGWCTYNADHMSMYAVNCSVPKTLVKYIIETYALNHSTLSRVLQDVLDTKISPELLPTKEGEIQQETETILGKYDLHDFFLYNFIRNGFDEEKILQLAYIAFPQVETIKIRQTLKLFFNRFYANQFKRNCVPDGVKIGSVSLSPRGDWRFPSEFLR